MKKIYMRPTAETIFLTTGGMIAGSRLDADEDNPEVTFTDEETGTFSSRGFSIWGDGDEE